VDCFLAARWQVRITVRDISRLKWVDPDSIEVLNGDLSDDRAMSDAVRGCDVVVHCAGLTKAVRPDDYFRVNEKGVGLLTSLARRAGVERFVLCSSQAASGPAADGVASRESDTPRPITDYGRSKLAGEEELRRTAGEMQWIILRPPAVLGPRDEQFLPLFKAAARWGISPSFGDSSQIYSYVYVKDLAKALLVASDASVGVNETYFVANRAPLSWEQAANEIAIAAGRRIRRLAVRPVVLTIVGLAGDLYARTTGRPALLSMDKIREIKAKPWVCSSDKIEQAWKFECEYSTSMALAETLKFYRETKRV
jgi:dihydroflavonol-4-reductase